MVILIKLMGSFILKVSFEYYSNDSRTNISLFSARDILPQWDKQIQSLCYQVNGIIEKIGAAEPEWIAKAMEEEMCH